MSLFNNSDCPVFLPTIDLSKGKVVTIPVVDGKPLQPCARSLLAKLVVVEQPDSYIVHVKLPGANKESIRVNIGKRILTISAEETIQKDGRYPTGPRIEAFKKMLLMPKKSDLGKVKAEFDDGMLYVTFLKACNKV